MHCGCAYSHKFLSPNHHVSRCRACSTAERTATNIVQAPIARAHRAPHAPHSSLTLPALCSCSLCSCSLLWLLTLVLPAPHSCSLLSLLLALVLPSLAAPFTRSSLLGFGAALRHFRAPHVRAILYLGFASQHLA